MLSTVFSVCTESSTLSLSLSVPLSLCSVIVVFVLSCSFIFLLLIVRSFACALFAWRFIGCIYHFPRFVFESTDVYAKHARMCVSFWHITTLSHTNVNTHLKFYAKNRLSAANLLISVCSVNARLRGTQSFQLSGKFSMNLLQCIFFFVFVFFSMFFFCFCVPNYAYSNFQLKNILI